MTVEWKALFPGLPPDNKQFQQTRLRRAAELQHVSTIKHPERNGASMARAGYCRVCAANVWLREDGSCQSGHAADEVSAPYEAESASGSPDGVASHFGDVEAIRARAQSTAKVSRDQAGAEQAAKARLIDETRRAAIEFLGKVRVLGGTFDRYHVVSQPYGEMQWRPGLFGRGRNVFVVTGHGTGVTLTETPRPDELIRDAQDGYSFWVHADRELSLRYYVFADGSVWEQRSVNIDFADGVSPPRLLNGTVALGELLSVLNSELERKAGEGV
jgi:hypothetical protein